MHGPLVRQGRLVSLMPDLIIDTGTPEWCKQDRGRSMSRRLIAVAAAVVFLAVLAPAVLLSERVSTASIAVLGVAALVGGLALSRDESRATKRAGRIVAVLGLIVLASSVGLFVLLYLGAFRGY